MFDSNWSTNIIIQAKYSLKQENLKEQSLYFLLAQ